MDNMNHQREALDDNDLATLSEASLDQVNGGAASPYALIDRRFTQGIPFDPLTSFTPAAIDKEQLGSFQAGVPAVRY